MRLNNFESKCYENLLRDITKPVFLEKNRKIDSLKKYSKNQFRNSKVILIFCVSNSLFCEKSKKNGPFLN